MFGKKKIKEICGNCKLYDPSRGVCRVVVLHEGVRVNVPVDPQDGCFYEQTYFDPMTKDNHSLINEVKQIRFWVEDEKGQKTDGHGSVKIEYPEGFFS